MGHHYTLRFELGGMVFDIATILMMVLTALLVFIFLFVMTRKLETGVPGAKQNAVEWIFDFVKNVTAGYMDHKKVMMMMTLGITLFLYIFIGNQLGVIANVTTVHKGEISESVMKMLTIAPTPEAEAKKRETVEHELGDKGAHVIWWKSPTATPSVTFGLALVVLLYSHYLGIKKSPGGWFKHVFLNPIHILEEFIIKPLTLPLRLFGNLFAKEIMIAFLLSGGILAAAPLFIWLGYSVFVGAIQAFIFLTLSMVYISQLVNDEH
ncbi:F0F1 ATP synthase subunit A [Brevibacillus porteri]|uniref:F0F1 ATP synthase subunit A n=1 Tax=Brevibacillus porteri TaxID=2126350 RepID=UPI003D1E6B27